MKTLSYTLLSDGPSDRVLMPILAWLLSTHLSNTVISGRWADLRRVALLSNRLRDRIPMALRLYPCDLLFVHRDLERDTRENRQAEITDAIELVHSAYLPPPFVCILPKRMTEAWLLFDEKAIREAAENPHGRTELNLPHLRRVEDLPDPKAVLKGILLEATGLGGRRYKDAQERIPSFVQRISQIIDDFSPLRVVPAFRHLENDLVALIQENGWDS